MARGAGLAPGPDSAELARWVASVRARAPREPAPSPELWNAPKLDAAASLARELHRAGDRVRKWTTQSPDAPPTATERGDALEEVVFHVVARAVPASALREDDEAHATDEAKDLASEASDSEAASFARAKALAESFPPFFSTRKDVAGGDGVPVRAFLGDTTGASALEEEEEEEAEEVNGVETEKTESVLPGDACARGLLLALADAPAGTRFLVRVAPEYAYLDPHHGPRMVPLYDKLPGSSPERCRSRRFPRPPAGVDAESFLFFDVGVLARRVAAPVRRPRSLPETSKRNTATAFPVPFATKRVLREGDGFERPRPPFDVSARVEVRVASPATDDEKTDAAAVAVPETVVRYVSGDGTLPPELDAAVDTMRVGEEAVVYAPPRRRPETPPKNARLAMPRDALERAAKNGAEYRVCLLGITHVRDVFGDGVVVKRRLEEGVGDFPGDCPVRDCAVTARVAVAAASISDDDDEKKYENASSLDEHARAMLGEEGDKNKNASGSDPFAALASRRGLRFVHDTGAQTPLAFRLGAGAVPAAVETSVRLMLPGETALVTVRDALGAGARYAYERSAPDAPGADAARETLEALGGVASSSGKNVFPQNKVGLVFVVRLVGFERPVNWYRAGLGEMLAEADAGRLEGNALLNAGKTELARDKYEKTLRDLRGIRGLETDEEIRATNALVNSVTLNLAAASQRLGFHARAIALVDEILSNDPKHGKALWRRGVSLAATHEYAGARADFRAVAEGDASLRLDVERELRKIDLAERAELRREKNVSASALGERAAGERRD
jgi:tetratricopeptide (TPR) repeat protein